MALLYSQKNLKRVTQDELAEAVRKHDMFSRARVGGARAILSNRDLSGLSLKGRALSGADFSGAVLVDADLRGANLEGAVFFTANLHRADLTDATLARADMRGANLSGAVFSHANLNGADLREGSMAVKDKRGNINLSLQPGKGNADAAKRLSGGIFTETVNASEAVFIGTKMQKCILRGANLSGAIFEGADLKFAQVHGAKFQNAVLLNTVLDGVELAEADLRGVLRDEMQGLSLEDAFEPLDFLLKHHGEWVATHGSSGKRLDFTRYDLRAHPGQAVDFKGAMLTMIKARLAIFFHLHFSGAEIQAADLRECDFRMCWFDRADLRGSDFSSSNMARATFQLAQLSPLKLEDGKRMRTDLSRCNLRYTDFTAADLREANFASADLSHADLRGANIEGADMTDAKMEGTYFDKAN